MPDPLDAKYRVFAVLWATCLLFDRSNRGITTDAFAVVVSLSALLVVVRPRATGALAFASVVYVAGLAWRRPELLMVHWYFDALVSLVIAGGWLATAIRERALLVPPAAMLRAFAPQARMLVLLALGFAGLAKLNTTFLDPDRSCAVALYLRQAREPGWDLVLSEAYWGRAAAIGLTVVAEVGVPFLVLSRRLRPVAIVLAAVFCFLLGVNPVGLLYEFSGTMLALLFLFTPDDLPARVGARLPPVPPAARVAVALALVAAALALTALGDDRDAAYERGAWLRIAWWLGVPGLVAVYLAHLQPVAERLALRDLFRGGSAPLWIVPAVMLANESVTYLGFPHETCFTMASDIRMLRGRNNHLFVRPPLLPGNAGVEIVGSTVPYLQGVRRRDARINLHTLRLALAEDPDARATFRVEGGPPETVARSGDDPRFRAAPFLGEWLRYAHQPTEQQCQHWKGVAPP